MRRILGLLRALALTLLAWAAPVAAQERLIESTIPEAIARVIRDQGYTVEIKKNDEGKPYMTISRNGWKFSADFYACDLVKGCESLQFYTFQKRRPEDTLERVNAWNQRKRFLKVAVDKDGYLEATMDVSLLGRMTRENIADVLDWWDVVTTEFEKFFPGPPKPAAGAAPAATTP